MIDSEIDPKDVCFVGLGTSAQCYYRVMLPAMAMGADWAGVVGQPPKLRWATGMVQNESKMPVLGEYKIVVLQQVCGDGWIDVIGKLRDRGVVVVWECDDYVHGVKQIKDQHDYAENFDATVIAGMEEAMKSCDAIIASTEWIASNYTRFNENAYVCRNGIDPARYNLTLPKRDTINFGWAGGTGHKKAVIPWFQQAAQVMRERSNTTFVTVGEPFARAFEKWFGPERALAVPWAAIEQYPGAMTLFDIALAPGGLGGFFKGKSDLRWLESGVLGIPVIAHPRIYGEIEHGKTGFKAESPGVAGDLMRELADDPDLRKRVGGQAKEFILENRTIDHTVSDWVAVFEQLLAEVE